MGLLSRKCKCKACGKSVDYSRAVVVVVNGREYIACSTDHARLILQIG